MVTRLIASFHPKESSTVSASARHTDFIGFQRIEMDEVKKTTWRSVPLVRPCFSFSCAAAKINQINWKFMDKEVLIHSIHNYIQICISIWSALPVSHIWGSPLSRLIDTPNRPRPSFQPGPGHTNVIGDQKGDQRHLEIGSWHLLAVAVSLFDLFGERRCSNTLWNQWMEVDGMEDDHCSNRTGDAIYVREYNRSP